MENQLPPLGPEKWGGNENFPPWGPKNGGEIPQNFSAPAAGYSKNQIFVGFCVVSCDKLPYSRRVSPLTRYYRVSKRFAVRASAYLNCFYEYKKALLPFVKTFWAPRLHSSLLFCDYRKTLLSFGIIFFANCAGGSRRRRRRFYYSQNNRHRTMSYMAN